MKKQEMIEEQGENLLVRVKVKPNSQEFKIDKINKWTGLLEVKLSQPARKGKANQELIEKLENKLNKNVRIKTGRRSNKKNLVVSNCSKEEFRNFL